MEQINEDYVSFETAKLLKEKGFDYPTLRYYYDEDGDLLFSAWRVDDGKNEFVAPTLQMAMKWLREVHEIFIQPNINFLYPVKYYCKIFCYGDNLKTSQDITTKNFESPEEACEAAIKYCLENLI